MIVGFGALYALLRVTRPPSDPAAVASFDLVAVSLTGVQLAELAVGVLGVPLVAGEYATGTIRVSFAAVPRRLPVLWGKAVVLADHGRPVPARDPGRVPGRPVGSLGRGARRPLSRPGAWPGRCSGALYLGAVGLLGLGLGTLLRSTAGAVAGLFGVLFAPQLPAGLPARRLVGPHLPVPAGAGRRGCHRRAASTWRRSRPGAGSACSALRRRRAGVRRLAAARRDA